MPLDRDEYVEQAYLFRTLRERMQQDTSSQELLASIRQEILATTRLPYAIDFMLSELRLTGGFATAMAHLPHYFTPFQTFVIAEGERAEGKFDFRVGLEVLRREAEYRVQGASPQGIFLYQFETLCRNRLGYDRGLEAMAGDDIYDDDWKQWILTVRRQVGLIDLGDMLYVRSELYRKHAARRKSRCSSARRKAASPWPIATKIRSICSPPWPGTWATPRFPARSRKTPTATWSPCSNGRSSGSKRG